MTRPLRSAALAALLLAGLALAPGRAAAKDAGTPAGKGTHWIVLVRHGAYDRDDHADERTANPLNALGREQSRRVAARLAALHVPVHALMTSDLLRARQTADAIGAALRMTPQVDTLIHECTPTQEHPEYATYHSPEDVAACVEQLRTVWHKYVVPTPDTDTWDVLVCHGNVIRWLMLESLGADVTRWYDPETANASLTVIEVRPDGTCRLVTYNDTGHMPAEKQSWAGKGWGVRR